MFSAYNSELWYTSLLYEDIFVKTVVNNNKQPQATVVNNVSAYNFLML